MQPTDVPTGTGINTDKKNKDENTYFDIDKDNK